MRLKLSELLLFVHIYLLPLSVSRGWCIISTAGLNGIVCFLPLTLNKTWQKQFPSSSVLSSQTVKVQITGPSEISVYIYQSTQRHTPEFFSVQPHFIFFSWYDITFTSVTASASTFVSCLCLLRYWRKWKTHEVTLMCVWPCIIYENDERYQLDETIVIYYHKYLYMFRASICPSSGVQVVCTAYGVQH